MIRAAIRKWLGVPSSLHTDGLARAVREVRGADTIPASARPPSNSRDAAGDRSAHGRPSELADSAIAGWKRAAELERELAAVRFALSQAPQAPSAVMRPAPELDLSEFLHPSPRLAQRRSLVRIALRVLPPSWLKFFPSADPESDGKEYLHSESTPADAQAAA